MASLSEAEATDGTNALLDNSGSKHDSSEVSEGDTTYNTCLDETIRLSDLDASTVSSNASELNLTIPKSEVPSSMLEADEKDPSPAAEPVHLESKPDTVEDKSDGVAMDGLKTNSAPAELIKLESAASEEKPDTVVKEEKHEELSENVGATIKPGVDDNSNPPIELVIDPKVESNSESESQPEDKITVKLPPCPDFATESEASSAVPSVTEPSNVSHAENNSKSAVENLDISLESDSKLDESSSGATSTRLDESFESVRRVNESLDSAPSDTHSESGAEETLQAAEYEREDGDGQEYDSSDGELGSDSEGEAPPVEPIKEKKIDDDEDRRNPQYIPKRGTFYEHDDRTADDDPSTGSKADAETDRINEQNTDKKVWKEHENRWTHDGYNEDEQKPKTRQEIIDTYGYDIRNEENAPRAVRRNKYGRGPNTYTRTWEDEKAYKRPSSGSAPPGGRGGNRGRDREPRSTTFYSNKVAGRNADRPQGQRKEAFPALPAGDSRRDASRSTSPPPREDRQPQSAWSRKEPSGSRDEYSKYGNNLPLQLTPPPQRRDIEVVRVAAPTAAAPAGRFAQPRADNIKPFRTTAGRGSMTPQPREALPDQYVPGRGRGRDLTNKRSGSGRISGDVRQLTEPAKQTREGGQQWAKAPASAAPKLKNQQDLANDLARINISPAQAQKAPAVEHQHYPGAQEYARRPPANEPSRNNQGYQQQQHERRQAEVPPRLQQQESAAKDAAANRPKRYSAIQQRSLPEPGAPIQQQQQQQQQAPAYAQQHQYYQHPPNYVPPQPPLQMLTAVHPPTTYATTFSAAPTFIQPPGPAPPPPHLMRRPPSPGHYHPAPPHAPQAVIGYVQQGQPPPQFQPQPYPPFQAFAAVQAASAAQPPELGLYQPQGGITYYSPAEQMRSRQQMTSERRQRAAIPIVPPPEYGRAHGRGDDAAYDQRDYGGAGDQGSYSDEDGDDYDDYNGGGDASEGMSRKIKQCDG